MFGKKVVEWVWLLLQLSDSGSRFLGGRLVAMGNTVDVVWVVGCFLVEFEVGCCGMLDSVLEPLTLVLFLVRPPIGAAIVLSSARSLSATLRLGAFCWCGGAMIRVIES